MLPDFSAMSDPAQVEEQQSLRSVVKRFVSPPVYIHCCNRCEKNGQALHLEQCLFCKSPNAFFDPDLAVEESVATEVALALLELHKNDPEPEPAVNGEAA